MNRRQLAFIILFNSIISLVIALVVVWAVEARRPDPEALAITLTPTAQVAIAPPVSVATATAAEPPVDTAAPTAEAAAVTATPRDFGETETYVVQTGDSLSSIADRFRVPIDDLVALNNLPNPDFVFVGQRLEIPTAGNTGSTTDTEETGAAAEEPITTGVIITAVEAPGDLLAEAVQITNDTDLIINLNGWTLASDDGPSYTFENVPLFAGNYIWLHTMPGDDTSIARYWGRESAAWTSGSALRLRNPDGTQVATFSVP